VSSDEPIRQFHSCNWCDEQPPHKHSSCVESPTGKHEDKRWVHKGRQGVEDHSPAPRHPKPREY